MDTPLKHWLTAHGITTDERRQLAEVAGLSANWFSQVVNGHRGISVGLAARLERASLELSRVRAGAVPVLSRGALCALCAACPHHPPVARDVL